MGKVTPALLKVLYTVLLLSCVKIGTAQTIGQTLKLTEFAIWGGSISPSSYKKDSAVIIKNKAIIQGNIGSNHLVDIKNDLTLTGSIYSGNIILLKNNSKVTGNVFAQRKGTTINPAISAGSSTTIIGILGALGKITVSSGQVTGKVAVAAPTNANYTGPAPSLGFITSFTLPPLPTMPRNTAFDNNVAANIPANNITNPTTPLKPGTYRKLALTGNKTLTFDGPGNYIFYEVDNGTTTNKFVFDFKNSPIGNINIFVIKDARWGTLTASTKNGDFPSRIFTEVHGTGSTFSGNSFVLVGPSSVPSGNYVWLGSVWAPNGGISITFNSPISASSAPQILGAIWSGKTVDIKNDMKLTYVALASPDLGFVDPGYEPPVGGKVAANDNIIGPELTALSQAQPTDPIITNPNNEIFEINTDKVLIEVISKNPNDASLKAYLRDNLGMTNEKGQPGTIDNGPHVYTQSGYLEINKIAQLKTDPQIGPLIQYVRPLYPPISNAGQTTTQGDVTMNSNLVRERFAADGVGVDGTGVKIGVISDSYNTNAIAAQDDVAQGDLPADVQLLDSLLQVSGTDEGRAMLQIVHDIAPKAKLVFHTGSLGAGPFARTIKEMASQNLDGGKCDVIVDDLTYLTEPFQSDGIVAQTVNEVVRDSNVVYVTSAGNFGRQSFEAVFNGAANASIIPGVQFHKFGADSTRIFQTLNVKPGSYTIVLQWEDESASLGSATGVSTDMDLYILSAAGFPLFGFNRSSLTLDPFEFCAFTVREESNVKLVVARAPGSTTNVRFKYIIFRGDATILDYQTGNSSIVGHANADSAITVGAMLYANIPTFTPVWPGVASFSSRGGTFTKQGASYIQRLKPDIIAPNGVNTTVALGGAVLNDGDPYPNFFGTSASAPHVAAVAALLIQGRKLFNLQTTVQQSEIRQQLRSSAGRFTHLPAGHSYEGGYGFVLADSAMLQVANARPIITSLEAEEPGAQNGTDSFVVKIKGQYLNETTEIYRSGVAVPTTVSPDMTEATATVPPIPTGEDPPFQVFNAAKSVSGQDGGLSEAKYFFSSKVNITVRAENQNRKYGQDNLPLTVQILRDGVPISSPDSIIKYQLDGSNLSLTTIATSTSRAALYGIVPSRTTPLAPGDPLLAQYDFTFVSGTLTVEKMPLQVKIVPKNREVKYGDFPGDVTYTYNLGQSSPDAASLLAEAKTSHEKYLANNGLVVLHGYNPGEILHDITNMGVMASFQSVRNARDFSVDGRNLSPLPDQRFFVDVSALSLTNYSLDPSFATTVSPLLGVHGRGLLNIKALAKGNASANVPNGQLKAMVNGQLMAMVNGQLQAVVNGQLKAVVNGILMDAADMVFQNGQLLAQVNGVWVVATNGQLQAAVNGEQLSVNYSVETNGQLKAVVNGQTMAEVNGHLESTVNGQLLAVVNGQLKAAVNGQLMPMVNGQLQAVVNGQLLAVVNGQLKAVVNGQLLAVVNGELQIIEDLVIENGQLKAAVNGQLQAVVNGQLKAMVNGAVNDVTNVVQGADNLQVSVNGFTQALPVTNGQLKAQVNGQLQPLPNSFDTSSTNNNNTRTAIVVDDDDINLQSGEIGGMFSMPMITGLNAGVQILVPGAFLSDNFEVTYDTSWIIITKTPLTISVRDTTRLPGEPNPPFTSEFAGLAYEESIFDPAVNPALQQLNRITSYSNVTLNGAANYITAAPGQSITLTGNYNSVYYDPTNYCPGCITQIHLGIVDENRNNVFNDCIEAAQPSGSFSRAFNAPMEPGVYFITQETTWWYFCGQFADPSHFNLLNSAIAVVFVNAATIASPEGTYPIPVGTIYDHPNYQITPKDGTLTVGYPCTTTVKHVWKGDGDFNDAEGAGHGSAGGGATANGTGLIGTNSFSFDGINDYIATGTAGSVSGTGDFFVSAWIKTTSDEPMVIINQRGSDNGVFGSGFYGEYFLKIGGNHYEVSQNINAGKAYFFMYDSLNNPTEIGVFSNTLVNDGNWHYIKGARSGTTMKLYIDGMLEGTVTTAGIIDLRGTIPTYIGADVRDSAAYFNGLIDDIRVAICPGTSPRPGVNSMPVTTTKVRGREDKLFPNPTTSSLRLILKDDLRSASEIRVFDAVGKMHSASARKLSEGNFDVNVSRLAKGLYFITAKTATGMKTFRFIKL